MTQHQQMGQQQQQMNQQQQQQQQHQPIAIRPQQPIAIKPQQPLAIKAQQPMGMGMQQKIALPPQHHMTQQMQPMNLQQPMNQQLQIQQPQLTPTHTPTPQHTPKKEPKVTKQVTKPDPEALVGEKEKNLPSLSDTLWEYRCQQQYTDLVLQGMDGVSHLHKAMVVAVLKTSGLGMMDLRDTDCLILPEVSYQELHIAIRALYREYDPKPLVNLLCCFTPLPHIKMEPRDRKRKLGTLDDDDMYGNIDPTKKKPGFT